MEKKDQVAVLIIAYLLGSATLPIYTIYESWSAPERVVPWEQITYTCYAWGANDTYFTMTGENTGLVDLSIAQVEVDGISVKSNTPALPYTLTKGSSVIIQIQATSIWSRGFVSGTQYHFSVVTAKGYPFGPYTQTAP